MLQVNPLIVVYFALAILFLLIGLLVIRKSRSLVNTTFSSALFLFSGNSFVNVLRRTDVELLNAIDPMLFLFLAATVILAPLGIMYSGFVIYDGSKFYQHPAVLWTTPVYILLQSFLWSAEFFELQLEPIHTYNVLSSLENGLICIPLIIAFARYYGVVGLIPEEKRNVWILLVGLVLAIVGQLTNALVIYLTENSSTLGLLLVVLGVVTATVAFSNIFSTKEA